jgi:prevent-host-death family protein
LSGGGVAKICRKGYIKKFKALITIRPGSHCMEKISVTDTNISLPELLKRIEQGKTILITRRGKTVAQLLPVANPRKKMPSLADFRKKVSQTKSSPLQVLETLRKEAR